MKRHFNHSGLLFAILLVSALAVSCRKNQPAPPPPPPVTSTPTLPMPLPTITLRATPASIERGNTASLRWEATNATAVRITPDVGDVSVTGNRDVSPASSVTYSATATGPGGTAIDNARITVNVPAPPPEAPPPPRTTANASIADLFNGNVKTIYFDYDKAEIRPDQMQILQANAAWLKQNSSVIFTIEGHCDERGSQEYNLALGDRRGNAVKQYLISQGISEARVNVISYGEERPACREETEACMQNNRRAEFKLNP